MKITFKRTYRLIVWYEETECPVHFAIAGKKKKEREKPKLSNVELTMRE